MGIAWAKEQGIVLSLNIHVPQGGFQSTGEGFALWDEVENQNRFKALWYNIAKRYCNEPTVIAYDLLNEPGVSKSKQQWEILAQQTIDTIRSVDTNHILIVERVNSVNKDWSNDAELNFINVNDPLNNLVFEFHFYSPIEYTHQLTNWTGLGDGGKYPDKGKIPGDLSVQWVGEKVSIGFDKDTIPDNWQYIKGAIVTVYDSNYQLAKPAINVNLIDSGYIMVDNFQVIEFNENDDSIGVVVDAKIEDATGFYLWSDDNSGNMSAVDDTINLGEKVIKITGCTSWANASNNNYRFLTTIGHKYQIRAWIKGAGVFNVKNIGMKFDFEKSNEKIYGRDREFLENEINKYVDYIHSKGVPAYCGEFGLYNKCFKNDKGGLNWVNDVLDILMSTNTAFTYHTYHEDAFGIFYGSRKYPSIENANNDLIELFKTKLGTGE